MAKKLFLLLLVMLPVMAMGQKKYEYVEKQFQKAMKNGKQSNGYYLAEKISRPQYQSSYTEDVASGKSITLKDLKQWAATHGYVLGKYTKVDRYGFIFDPEGVCVNTVYFIPRAEQEVSDGSWSKTTNNGGRIEGKTFNGSTRMLKKGVWVNDKFTGWQVDVRKQKCIYVENDKLMGDWSYPNRNEARDLLNEYLDSTLSKEEKEKELAVGTLFSTSEGNFKILSDKEVVYKNEFNKDVIDLSIPSSVTYLGSNFIITKIGNFAFEYNEKMKSVTIPSTVTEIGFHAFDKCISLESIVIPNSVDSIGYGAFYGCESLKSVSLPVSLRSIGERAFENCKSLMPFAIPSSCTYIGAKLFAGCLKSYDYDCTTIDLCLKKLKANHELSDYEASVLEGFVKTYFETPAKDVKNKRNLAKELISVNKVLRALNLKYEDITYWRREPGMVERAFGVKVDAEWTTGDKYVQKIVQEGLDVVKTNPKSQFGLTQIYQKGTQILPQKMKDCQDWVKKEKAAYDIEVTKDKARHADYEYRRDMAHAIDEGKVRIPKYKVEEREDSYHIIKWEDDTRGTLRHDKNGWYVSGPTDCYYKTYEQAVKALYVSEKYHFKAKDGLK